MPKFQVLKALTLAQWLHSVQQSPHWRKRPVYSVTHVTPLARKGRCTAGPYPRRRQYAVVPPTAAGITPEDPSQQQNTAVTPAQGRCTAGTPADGSEPSLHPFSCCTTPLHSVSVMKPAKMVQEWRPCETIQPVQHPFYTPAALCYQQEWLQHHISWYSTPSNTTSVMNQRK
jgi:hypothetical protein